MPVFLAPSGGAMERRGRGAGALALRLPLEARQASGSIR